MPPDIRLHLDGKAYLGWKMATVSRSMEALASTFSLDLVDRWAPESEPWPIYEGDACSLDLGGRSLVQGYVDDSTADEEGANSSMSITGRAKTGDLVDCSAVYKTGKWRDASLSQIAKDLCAPFSIGVSAEADEGKPFRRFALQDGESVHEALERGARMRGLLLMTDDKGNLLLTRAGARRTRTVIRRGANVLRGGRRGSMKERFGEYIVKAQAAGGDSFYGRQAAGQKRTSKDGGVSRYRPLVVQAEDQEAGDELQKRADWERNVRAGRSLRLAYTVLGWETDEGVWDANLLARIEDERFGIDGEFLVVTSNLRYGEAGELAELELVDPKAMSVEPLSAKPKRGGFYL